MGWFGQGPERAAGEPAPASIVKVSKVELAPPAGAKISKANKFAKEKGLSPKETEELRALIAEEAKEKEEEKEKHHHHEGAMPLFAMPEVLQRNGEEQAEVHIGWADIYLDLILVGVAFNGGLLLKHAFYLCTPPGEHGEHGGEEHGAAEHGAAEHGGEHGEGLLPEFDHAKHSADMVYTDAMPDSASEIHRLRQLNGHEHHEHGPCLGLPVGLLHVLAFGCPIIFAWLKETILRSRFESRSLASRGLECLCYLLMIVGASCEEDVTVLQSDSTFWYVFGACMFCIDAVHILRYAVITFHEEDCARKAAKEQICVMLPGSLIYLLATLMALSPDQADGVLDGVTPVLFGWVHDPVHTHIWYIPGFFVLAANTPLLCEIFLFSFTSFKTSVPINVHFVLHRATEVFMVLLGEAVLQLITSQSPEPPPGTPESEELATETRFALTQIMGFVITLTIMHSFVIIEPEPEYHVLNRGGPKALLWLLLFVTKSLAVWLVGIGIKIALYDPNAAGDAFFGEEQRRQFGSACFTCYVFGNVMGMMHAHSITKYLAAYIAQNAFSLALFGAWLVTIVGMVALTYSTLDIFVYMQCQCALGVLHMIIVQLETVWMPAMGLLKTPDQVAGHPSFGKSQAELFKEMLHEALSENAGKIVELFRQMDEDGDGTVNKEEFRNVDTMLGIGDIPDEIIDELFSDWDPDGSGSIELDELNQLLRKDGLGAKDGL